MREKSRSQINGAQWTLIHWKPNIDRRSSIGRCCELSVRKLIRGKAYTPRSAFEQRDSPRSKMFISFEFRLHTQQSPQWLQSKDWLMGASNRIVCKVIKCRYSRQSRRIQNEHNEAPILCLLWRIWKSILISSFEIRRRWFFSWIRAS